MTSFDAPRQSGGRPIVLLCSTHLDSQSSALPGQRREAPMMSLAERKPLFMAKNSWVQSLFLVGLKPAGQNAPKSNLLARLVQVGGGAMAGEHEAKGREEVRLLNVKDAARLLGTTPASLYSVVWKRQIVFVKIGRSLRFDLRDLERLIEEAKVKPHTDASGTDRIRRCS
jgi:hypothetical protein